jgi:hypothetical protein
MKYFWLLITDKTNALVINNSLPSHQHWPSARPFKKNSLHDSLFNHILCGLSRPSCVKKKMKRTFGMPTKSSWSVYEIESVESLVKDIKRIQTWWTIYAAGQCPFKLKSLRLDDEHFDITSAIAVKHYVDTLK